ncbi:hypothetical protein [Micromonospora sp. NPDC023956]
MPRKTTIRRKPSPPPSWVPWLLAALGLVAEMVRLTSEALAAFG